jgi:4,5-DOPA dioxygenase extradiol
MMMSGEYRALLDYERIGSDATLSIPTPEHYLPLLYILALRERDESLRFPVDGFDGGSISMLSVQIG